MDIITGKIDYVVLGVAAAIFLVYGIIQPLRDKKPFIPATIEYVPKVQCIALAALGYGITGIDGTVADWFNDSRTWLLDQATDGAKWALGGVGVLALAVVSGLLLFDYLAPGGLEPNSGKPWGHLLMWLDAVVFYPLLQLALGSISLVSLAVVFAAVWFFNVKFRKKKGGRRETAAASA
jgi:hypothetical protein